MKLIADSGSTKTHWVILDESGIISEFRTYGLNPHYVSEEYILNELNGKEELRNKKIDSVFFYGAGCSLPEKKKIIGDALLKIFPAASITVETDIFGAAIGMSYGKKSFVAILGTGSNCCLFDGEKIIHSFISTGFYTGDEGSGGYIGKKIILAYSEKYLPQKLQIGFEDEYKTAPSELMLQFQNHPFPNRFAASFMPWVLKNSEDDFINKLIRGSFQHFFDKTICTIVDYEKIPLQITGSVGFYFRTILQEAAREKNIFIENIKASPMEGLAQYHLKHY